MDRRVLAAKWTLRVLSQSELTEAHAKGVEEYQAADERIALAQDQLECFVGLQGADDAG